MKMDIIFNETLNDINYKITVIKLHNTGQKKRFTSTNVSMLVYGCGVSQYPKLCYQELDKYQVLPRPNLNLGFWDRLKDRP